jgi:uroporphyrinogen-III synthase
LSDDVSAAARDAAARAELVIIGSVRTLDILWPGQAMPDVEVAAVGERTASAVRRRGGRVVVAGSSGLLGLVEMSRSRLVDAEVVFPHAIGSDRAGLDALRLAANALKEFEIYKSAPIAPSMEMVDAVAFASPSAVEGWHLARDLASVIVGVIGSTTAGAVRLHREPDVVASKPSFRALAETLASHMEVPA